MKNRILYILISALIFFTPAYSVENYFIFKTQNIEIKDSGNLIEAYDGKVVSKDGNFEISADKFQYFKNLGILKINGNGFIIHREKNFKIEFDKGEINQKKSVLDVTGKILAEDQNIDLRIETEKLNFNYKDNILLSNEKSIIRDKFQNILISEKFKYEIQNELIKLNKLKLTDENDNSFELNTAYLNTKTNNLLGKDLFLELDNKTLNKESEPRLKGNSVINNQSTTTIMGGVFTSCKRRDGCPPWQISAKKIEHKKEKKTINYKDAILKIYDFPVAYFPKFHHPDPTVKRQSGFLTPSLKRSTNRKNFFEIPYYLVISDSKDTTLSSRFYNDAQFLIQNEFRSVKKNSNHISDLSLKFDDNKKLRSHLFYEYKKLLNFDNFFDSDLSLKIQQTSKDTYLKKNKIKSKIGFDSNVLENSANLNFSREDMQINFEAFAYEDLNKNDSDRYEYILPKINLSKMINNKTKLNGDFSLNSKILNKNYDTNVFETINTNDLKFLSEPKISQKGFYNNYEFLVRNTNTKANNSKLLKNKESGFLSGLLQFNSSMPLVKSNEDYKKLLNPKISLKIAPEHTKNNRNTDNTISIDNIYSFSRYSEQDTVEGGISLTYGSEYSIFDEKKSLNILDVKIANNLRLKKNEDLPVNNQFHEQVSNFVNEISFKPNHSLDMSYKSSIKNNFADINSEQLITKIKINNLITSFDYYNQNEFSNKNTYISNTTILELDELNSFSFSTRRNKTIDLTEYYNLAYKYKNDCLTASIEYNKDYYSDRDIKPDEGIFLKITIVPPN